jgi:hypothetical protein
MVVEARGREKNGMDGVGEEGDTLELVRQTVVMTLGCQRILELGVAWGGGGAGMRPARGQRVWGSGTARKAVTGRSLETR